MLCREKGDKIVGKLKTWLKIKKGFLNVIFLGQNSSGKPV